MMMREVLVRWPLFSLFPPAWLEAWSDKGEERILSAGEVLYQAGSYARWIYVIVEGRVRVLRQAENNREISLGTFGPGDVFGEYALLPPNVLPATCRAAGTVIVRRLKLRTLKLAIAEHASLVQGRRSWLRLHALLRYLRDSTFLGFMSASSFLPLLERFQSLAVAAGSTLQADGLADDTWFFILKGRVAAAAAVLGPNDCFGAQALAGWPTFPTASAETPVECLCLKRPDFLRGIKNEGPRSLQTLPVASPGPAAYPHVAQTNANDCGVAALVMLARAHGRFLSLDQVRPLLPLGQRGSHMAAMVAAAERLGFRARPVRIVLDQLAHTRLPAIAHLAGDHWVVVYACQSTEVVIGDPASSVRGLPRADFQASWTGNLLLLSPPANPSGESLMASWIVQPPGGGPS